MCEFPHDLSNDFCLNIFENFKEIPEMLGIDGPAGQLKVKFSQLCYNIANNQLYNIP